MSLYKLVLLLLLVMLANACSEPKRRTDSSSSVDPLPQAPWQEEPLAQEEVPPVYLVQWRKSENRASCALLAPASLGTGEGAEPRAATFAGGWAVAYDTPQVRSAFGVAGTGASASAPSYAEWPFTRRWADSSSAGYGPEGGTGPNQLAYLRLPHQDCLYNVWSRLGREHLEYLLGQLRFVQGTSP